MFSSLISYEIYLETAKDVKDVIKCKQIRMLKPQKKD